MTAKEFGYHLAHISRPQTPPSQHRTTRVNNVLRPLWISTMRAARRLSEPVGVLHVVQFWGIMSRDSSTHR
jgi:hypothetical protein